MTPAAGNGRRCHGCGAELRFESRGNGLTFWRCPVCYDVYWFLVPR